MKSIHSKQKTLAKIAAGISIALFSFTAPAAQKLKFAHVYEVDHALHQAALDAAEKIKEATEGNIEIEVFPASSLGQESAINEALALGTVDIIYTGTQFAGTSYGPLSITGYPFVLRDVDHLLTYRDSDLFQEFVDGYKEATGNTILTFSYYGSRHVTSNKEINVPDDMQNLKIRVPNAPAYFIFPEAVGANPTPMAFAEVYLGLQQGVVDAQENPLTTIRAKKFYEVQSHISLTGHITDSILTIISQYTLDKLSEEEQQVVIDTLKESADWVTEQIIQQEEELVGWFGEQGITVTEVERQAFMDKVQPALTSGDLPFTPEHLERLQAL